MDLVIRRAKIFGTDKIQDIGIKNNKFMKISNHIATKGATEISANGKIVAPPFVDSHVHLDSALTAGQPRYNMSGTLLEGIQVWSEYKETMTEKQVKKYAKKTIKWLVAQGVLRLRTHTDCSDENLTSIRALLQLKDELKDIIDIQVVAFPQDGIYAYKGMDRLLKQAVELGVDVIGGMPQAEITREDGIAQLEYIFQLAKKHNKMIDIHTDETGDDHSRFAEVIAKLTIKYNMQGQVTASHTTAMHNYHNDYANKLIGNLKRAKVNIVTNPFSNTMLQNRLDGYPKYRGTTRVNELLDNGVNVSIGNDNIMDPFNPLGRGNLLQAAHLLAHTAHMSSHERLNQLFHMITVNGAKTLNDSNYGIQLGNKADCIILNCTDEREAIRLLRDSLYVIRHGEIIAQTTPANSEINFTGQAEVINFT